MPTPPQQPRRPGYYQFLPYYSLSSMNAPLNLATLGMPGATAPVYPPLPPLHTMTVAPRAPKKVLPPAFSLRAYARFYVHRRLVDQFKASQEAKDFMTDLLVSIRHVRGMYAEYLQRMGEVVIDADAYEELLSHELLAVLRPGQRAQIKDLIISEAGLFTRDLNNTLRLLADALSHASETMDVMDNKLDARIATYCKSEPS